MAPKARASIARSAISLLRRAAAPLLRQSAETELTWLRNIDVRTFIDVGAHRGEYVDFAARLYPNAAIYAFEPLADCAKLLREKQRELKQLHVIDKAVGDRAGETEFFKSSYAPASSLLPMTNLTRAEFPEAAGAEREVIAVTTLDDYFADATLQPEIFMKVDTQGYEDRVIRGGRRVLERVRVLLIEVSFEPLYEGQLLFDDINSELRSLGLAFHGIKSQVKSPETGEIFQAHAFFVRSDARTVKPR